MNVYTNRIRRSYLRKRERKQLALAVFLLVLVFAASGIAATQDQRDAEKLFQSWNPAKVVCQVEWADSVPMYVDGGK